ncbi:Nramp-domain-containing protein, partial [Violaceomyces palustris]
IKRHMRFIGPGLVASTSLCDAGNFASDLQAGSQFGYSLLFVVLLSGLFAVLFQILACRLGVVTG